MGGCSDDDDRLGRGDGDGDGGLAGERLYYSQGSETSHVSAFSFDPHEELTAGDIIVEKVGLSLLTTSPHNTLYIIP